MQQMLQYFGAPISHDCNLKMECEEDLKLQHATQQAFPSKPSLSCPTKLYKSRQQLFLMASSRSAHGRKSLRGA
jgi:hypothetical protein